MAKWLSLHARLGDPGFCWFGSWAWTWHCSSSHVEVASHVAQPEVPTTRIYNYVLGVWGRRKRKKKLGRLGRPIKNPYGSVQYSSLVLAKP